MVSESIVKQKVITHLESKRFRVFDEVPILEKRIDLVGYDPKRNVIVAIEAKVANWHKAVGQALAYRLVAEQVYVAMWHENIHRVDMNLFKEFGIGIMEVDGKVRTLLQPTNSQIIHNSLRKRIEEYVGGT